jgi:hypothetical protein
MKRVETKLNGITTTSACKDGDFISLVNLRGKNGALRPVTPRKILTEKKIPRQYDIVFIHRNSEYENWIGVINDTGESSVFLIRDNPQDPLLITKIEGVSTGGITGVEQIGNTLSLITSDEIYYLLFQSGVYRSLGVLPEIPVISLQTGNVESDTLSFFGAYGLTNPHFNADTIEMLIDGLVHKTIDLSVNGGSRYVWPSGSSPTITNNPAKGPRLFDACFIQYAFRLFDGTLAKYSPPLLVMPGHAIFDTKKINIYINDGEYKSDGVIDADQDYNNISMTSVTVEGYRIDMAYDLTDLTPWNDIIQSVDIFMSKPLGISKTEGNIKKIVSMFPDLTHNSIPDDNYIANNINLIDSVSAEAEYNIKNPAPFFFVKSLDPGVAKNFGEAYFPTSSDDQLRIESLENQEAMPVADFSNHKQGARLSYVYNNRLHIANIKTTFFKGYDIRYFLWHGPYNGVEKNDQNWGSSGTNERVTGIKIQTAKTKGNVYTKVSTDFLFTGAFISYPDVRAKELSLYEKVQNKFITYARWPLTPHDSLNVAYYISPALKPATGHHNSGHELPTSDDLGGNITLMEYNKIKVSAPDNPLVFPVINTYTVGDGTILAMATNLMRTADWNYGQYPLYVFTTEGVWAMNVGSGEVVYSTSSPVLTDTPVSRVVCSTPYGVVFISKRGLMCINGGAVEFISPQLEEAPETIDIKMPTSIVEVSPGVTMVKHHANGVILHYNNTQQALNKYLEGVDNILYDPYESELIICNTGLDFNYVFNIPGKHYYQSTEVIKQVVKNAFPDLFVMNGTTLKDYGAAQSDKAHVSFITRPLSFGTDDIKQLDRLILRGIFYDVTNPQETKESLIVIGRSNDGVNFKTARGRILNPANYKDIDSGLLSRNKFRWFMLSFGAVLKDKSKIFLIKSMVGVEYTNEKMR